MEISSSANIAVASRLGMDTYRAEEFCAKSEMVQGTPDQRAIRSPLHMAGFAQRDGAVVF